MKKALQQKTFKYLFFIGVGIFSLVLVGCSSNASNKNPLMTQSPHEVGEALMHASRKAEKQFHFNKKIIPGSAYGLCMPEIKAPMTKARCQTLYRIMVKDLKAQPGFNDVTVNRLMDPNLFARIEAAYEQAWFMQV